jgi:peptidoglycan/xylan/chitin deacetylase (PgdA/CDA1 family)
MSLIYHDVRAQTSDRQPSGSGVVDWYAVSPGVFSSHLDAIGMASTEPSLVTAGLARDRLFLTFDDGEVSAITTVASMLEQRLWRGHFFIITSRIGTPGYLSEADLRALAARGHVIGSHSHTHPIMTELGEPQIRAEWTRSREILETILGESVVVASVPTGHYAPRIGRLAVECGYQHVFTSEPWLKPRSLGTGTIYGRFMVRRGTNAELVRAVCSFSRPALTRQRLAWQSRKVLKVTLGRHYEDVRRAVISRL